MNEQPTKLEAIAGIFGAIGQIFVSLGCLIVLLPLLAFMGLIVFVIIQTAVK